MTPTDADYWRDAYGMFCAEQLPHDIGLIAVMLSQTGEEFNAAIWAAIRLQEILGRVP